MALRLPLRYQRRQRWVKGSRRDIERVGVQRRSQIDRHVGADCWDEKRAEAAEHICVRRGAILELCGCTLRNREQLRRGRVGHIIERAVGGGIGKLVAPGSRNTAERGSAPTG